MASSRSSLVVAMAVVILHRWCCAAAPAAAAANRTRTPALFVFGDSIVDAGNNNAITTLIRCNFAPYGKDFPGHNATGRFSNGKVPGDILGTASARPWCCMATRVTLRTYLVQLYLQALLFLELEPDQGVKLVGMFS
jgi:hypothetical protein